MSNVTPFTGNLPAVADAIANLKKAARAETPSANTNPFLRLGKDGSWVYGPESIDVEEGSEWAIHPGSFAHGLVCWDDGALLGEVMANVSDAKPLRSDVPDYGPAWTDQVAFQLACVSGEDKGINTLYKTSSRGGKSAWAKIADEIATQAESDPVRVVPIVTLEVDSYVHKKFGRTFTPEFKVVRWESFDGIGDPAEPKQSRRGAKAAVEATPAPAARKRRGR